MTTMRSFVSALYRPLTASTGFSPLARSVYAVPVASFKTATALRFQLTSAARSAASGVGVEQKSKAAGSYHWTFERSLSVISLPLFGSAVFFGSIPAVDFLLGFAIPMHCYFGFESMVIDYFPKHRFSTAHSLAMWSLRLFTALTMYGCYLINTTDVGLTALAKRLWTGKE
ncbi:hypothetical protein QVD99_005298 [Batrachochytrium dendrobatidis]|nr:hypothetical protein O5D80_004367 [Batrachochytrium dendrobatidis]KAK5668262.1 hypothetical protein QVD99_005298 [Batrachochytrium dendrobatidis]